MDLFNVVKSTKAIETIPEPSGNMAPLNSDAVFAAIKDKVAADPAKAKSVNGVFLYKITKDGKVAKEWSKLKTLHRKSTSKSGEKVQRLRKLLNMQNFYVLIV